MAVYYNISYRFIKLCKSVIPSKSYFKLLFLLFFLKEGCMYNKWIADSTLPLGFLVPLGSYDKKYNLLK